MSIVLNGSSQYARRDAPVASAAPFTVAAWFKSTSDSAFQCLWSEADESTLLDYWRLGLRGHVAGDPLGLYVRRAGVANAVTSTGYTVGTWHHAMFVETGSQDHKIYIDGGSEGSDTVNDQAPNPAVLDEMAVGALAYNNGWTQYFAGKVAEVAIWNMALSPADRIELAGGANPALVQPENLVAYYPFEENANDYSGNNLHLTTVGSPSFDTEDNPPVASGSGHTIVVNGTPAIDNTFYELGEVEMISGDNSGQKRPVALDSAGTITVLWPFVGAIVTDDEYNLYPGCDLRGVTCHQKFHNETIFRGFIHVRRVEDAIM